MRELKEGAEAVAADAALNNRNISKRPSNKRTQVLFLSFVSFGFVAASAAWSATSVPKTSSETKNVIVPVYYVTDRNLQGETYGNRRRYPKNCLHKMYYGTAFINVRNYKHEDANELLEKMDWKLTSEKPKRISPKDRVSEESEPRQHFFERITKALEMRKTDKLCVYVPGAEEGFEDACSDAAELEYHVKRPVILYSWPSEPKLLDYFVDNNNSEWSQGHFKRFIQHLHQYKDHHPLRVAFVAHSMGNRFILRSVRDIYRAGLAADLELVSADIDLDTCRHYLLGFDKVDKRSAIRFYVSNRDRMLKLSQRIFGGYARLGEHVEHQLFPSRSVEDVVIEKDGVTKPGKKNGQKVVTIATKNVNAHEDLEDGASEEKDEHSKADVFEVVDFTAVDRGFVGHSMPFQLIADMINGKQPAGFKVVTSTSTSAKQLPKGEKDTENSD